MIHLAQPYIYADGYVSVDVSLPPLAPSIELGGTTYQAKSEYHCSLIAIKNIVPVVMEHEQSCETQAQIKVSGAALDIITVVKPTLSDIGPEFRIADHPARGRRTVIVMVRVAGLDQVFARLSQILGFNIPVQPTHITLYTLSGLAIGVTSPRELDRWTRPLTAGEARELQEQLPVTAILGVRP